MSVIGYRVLWLTAVIEHRVPEFVNELARRGESAQELYDTIDWISRLLSIGPGEKGESRADGQRVLIESPLAVRFEVHEDERLVVVVSATYRWPKSDRD